MKYLLVFALLLGHLSAQTYEPTWDSLDKRPTPQWYTEAKFGIFIHWGVYSVPAYAPVIPGKLAYSEWYWHQMTEGRDNPKANAVETGTWAFHQKTYGASFPYQSFAPQFKAELFDPSIGRMFWQARAPNTSYSPRSITMASLCGPARKPRLTGDSHGTPPR